MKRAIWVLAVLALAGCASTRSKPDGASGPITMVVNAKAPLRQADADLLRRVTEEYVERYVHDGRPLTVTITVGEPAMYNWGRDPASSDYWAIEQSYSTQSGHSVPLVGGLTTQEVGFAPVVGQGGSGGYVSRGSFANTLVRILTTTYSIADASGKVIESRTLPLFPEGAVVMFVGPRLEDYHDIGMYIAERIKKVR